MATTVLGWFLQKPEDKVKPILLVQKLQCTFLDRFATFASNLCEEEFYMVLFCFLGWYVDIRLVTLMCSGYLFGNMLKNVLCVPRPISPPVYRIRGTFDVEDYSFPSTHSLQAVSLPLFVTYYTFVTLGSDDMQFFWQWNLSMTGITLSIIFSRLYLGAHHIQDVVAGVSVGLLLGGFYSYLSPLIDFYNHHGTWQASVLSVLVFVALVFIHPNELYWKSTVAAFNQVHSQSAYLVSSAVAGCAAGCCVAGWLMGHQPELATYVSWFDEPLKALLRVLVGPVLLLLDIPLFDPPSKPAAATGATKSAEWKSPLAAAADEATGAAALKARNGGTPSLLGSGIQVMPVVKFLQYSILALFALYICPLMYANLGI